MRIGICDFDIIQTYARKIPNLDILKYSEYHRRKGDSIVFERDLSKIEHYDKFYLRANKDRGHIESSVFDHDDLDWAGDRFGIDNEPPKEISRLKSNIAPYAPVIKELHKCRGNARTQQNRIMNGRYFKVFYDDWIYNFERDILENNNTWVYLYDKDFTSNQGWQKVHKHIKSLKSAIPKVQPIYPILIKDSESLDLIFNPDTRIFVKTKPAKYIIDIDKNYLELLSEHGKILETVRSETLYMKIGNVKDSNDFKEDFIEKAIKTLYGRRLNIQFHLIYSPIIQDYNMYHKLTKYLTYWIFHAPRIPFYDWLIWKSGGDTVALCSLLMEEDYRCKRIFSEIPQEIDVDFLRSEIY